jgi:DNA-binding MarR family transcriptional regulator
MANKYDKIQQLIGLWEEYETITGNADFKAFGKWLQDNETKFPATLPSSTEHGNTYPEFTTKQKIPFFLARAFRIQEFYCKKFFDGLEINTLLEFAFLYSTSKKPGMKKSELINLHVVEYTTGIDMINRLKKQGLLTEIPDLEDKRSKKIEITREGKKTIMEALLRLSQVNDFFLDGLDNYSLNKLLSTLSGIDEQHREVYLTYNHKPYFDLFLFIESRKEGKKSS